MAEYTIMKNENEIHEEIERNLLITKEMINKQKKNIPLSEMDRLVRTEANTRINALLWVLGEFK